MKKRYLLVLIIVLLAGVNVFLFTGKDKSEKINEELVEAKLAKQEAVVPQRSPVFKTSMPKRKPSEYKIGLKYDEAMKSDKPFVQLIYADWCTYCQKFMPKYEKIAKIYKGKYNFVMTNVDAPENKEIVKAEDIGGFPTMYIKDPKYDNKISLNNTIFDDLLKLRIELDRYLRIREKLK